MKRDGQMMKLCQWMFGSWWCLCWMFIPVCRVLFINISGVYIADSCLILFSCSVRLLSCCNSCSKCGFFILYVANVIITVVHSINTESASLMLVASHYDSIWQHNTKKLTGNVPEMAKREINPLPHGDANRHTIFKRKN